MTSQASSPNKSVAGASFRFALRGGSLYAALFTATLLVLLPLSTLVHLLGERQGGALKDTYVFVLGTESGLLSFFLLGQTVLFSLILGVVMFRFMLSERASNVYASMGVKRSALFLSRYFAGLLLLTLSIAVPFLLSGLISGIFLGFNVQLLWSLLFATVSFVSLAAVCYTVFACVACGVGTLIESLAFSLLLLGAPSVFFGGLSLCASVLLYGCPFSLTTYLDSGGQTRLTGGLFGALANYNPLTFAYSGSSAYLAGYKGVDGLPKLAEMFGASEQNWVRPDFTPALIWLLVSAVIALIAVNVYRHRKMEIAGFLGAGKTLNRLAAFICGSGCYMLTFLILQHHTVAAMIVGSLAMLLTIFVILLILTHSAKAVCQQLHLMLLQLVSITAVFLVLISGGFGYAARLPETEAIRYAEISSVAVNTVPVESGNSSVSPYGYDAGCGFTLEPALFGKFTTARDIEQVRSIHSKFIQLGSEDLKSSRYLDTCVLIRYTLKNGQTLLRYYYRADMAALNQCLTITDSDLFREQLQTAFHSGRIAALNEKIGEVVAVNAALDEDSFHPLTLTEQQHAALKTALLADLSRQSVLQRFFPETPAVGALWFRVKDIDGAPNETGSLPMNYNPANAANEPVFYLTADMTDTLAFLEKNDLMGLFEAQPAESIKSISFCPAAIKSSGASYDETVAFTPDVHAVLIGDTADFEDEETLTFTNPVTDQKQIAALLPNMHLHYFTQGTGYFCCIEYEDGTQVRKYITEADAPDSVRYYNYN